MNQMNSGDYGDGQWFPRLPEGYNQQHQQQGGWPGMESQQMAWPWWNQPSQQNWDSSQHYQQGWPDSSHPQGWPGSQHSHNQPGWPGIPNPSHQQGWPGSHQQPGWPWPGGGNPGRPPSYPGTGGGSGNPQEAPKSAPPSKTPAYPDQQLMRVDPGGIQGCLYRNTYIWTSRRSGFWFYPTFVGRTSIAGFRWNSQWRRWEYTGLDLDRVDAFTCV